MKDSNCNFSKWVAFWGNATSISNREIQTYSKDLTLRYPIYVCFNGNKLRFHFSNFTGTEDVKITKAFVTVKNDEYNPISILFNGEKNGIIPAGKEILSDEVEISIKAGDTIDVSMYFADFTQMNAGTLVTGPLSKGTFAYGDFSEVEKIDINYSKATNWFYFLNTVDIFTENKNRAIICYGDSITAQSWPDYLTLKIKEEGIKNTAVIRRAVCGTRILRQYDCITYQAYGLKGETRFNNETEVSGADTVIIQHGINDIIHPVGTDVNVFRPMSDMPSVEDLISGFEKLYVSCAKAKGLKIIGGTLLPIKGWRTYADFREDVRTDFNQYLRSIDKTDGLIDFDKAVRCESDIYKFKDGFDSGDHLHPSEKAYKVMAEEAFKVIFG